MTVEVATATVMSTQDAEAITRRIRTWINDCPVEDIARAYAGRIWLALGYESWAEYCECELNGGLILPEAKRVELEAQLAGLPVAETTDGEPVTMPNTAIADVVGVGSSTVDRDLSTSPNGDVDPARHTLGQDGKIRKPRRKPEPESESDAIDAEVVEPPPDTKRPTRRRKAWHAKMLRKTMSDMASTLDSLTMGLDHVDHDAVPRGELADDIAESERAIKVLKKFLAEVGG